MRWIYLDMDEYIEITEAGWWLVTVLAPSSMIWSIYVTHMRVLRQGSKFEFRIYTPLCHSEVSTKQLVSVFLRYAKYMQSIHSGQHCPWSMTSGHGME